MPPNDSSIRRMGKYVDGRNVAENQIPEIIVGPKSSADEIWVDGIEHLHASSKTDTGKSLKKQSSIQNRSSMPYFLEQNNNVKAKAPNCFGTDTMNEVQEYLIGNKGIIFKPIM
jgi:hypothetical protein